MNKQQLNNEIVLCRASVRKAKVIVMRKIIKKMKILKSCKIEALKEKKLKKAERLFKRLQIMKKLKDDEVTKFALKHGNPNVYLKEANKNTKQIALAHLAKHEAVARKISTIKEKFSNWETELPLLLNSIKKSSVKRKDIQQIHATEKESDKKAQNKGHILTEKTKKSVPGKSKMNLKKTKKQSFGTLEDSNDKDEGVEGEVKEVELEEQEEEEEETEVEEEEDEEDEDEEEHRKQRNKNKSLGKSFSEDKAPVEKIDDPFFVGKKVIAPKLVLESNDSKNTSDTSTRKISKDVKRFKKEDRFSSFQTKSFKGKKEFNIKKPLTSASPAEEKLHPSWAAKKVKLIQPFQGRKITFSDT